MTGLRRAVLILGCIMVMAGAASAAMPERVALGNGLVVILAPIPGSGRVAVESFYRAGVLEEPEGMPQMSHLVEHLVCQGATKSYKAGESMGQLSKKGDANAETMFCFTHYDYMVPSSDLELAVKVEAERLSSLKITQDVIDKELPKCYSEITTVEKNPANMYKFAFTAFDQAWRYKAANVTVKSGLEKAPPAKVQEYHDAHYLPSGAVLVLVGDFDRAKALDMAKKYLGSIPSRKVTPAAPIQWDNLPKRMDVQWDSSVRAVCLGFRPSGSVSDRYLLQTLGGYLPPRLALVQKIADLTDCIICSDPVWTTNNTPFYIYAVPKPNASIEDLQKALNESLQTVFGLQEIKNDITQAIGVAQLIGKTEIPPRDMVVSATKQMYPDMEASRAEGMVLGQVALEYGFEEMISGGKPNYLSIPDDMTADTLLPRLKAMLDPSKEFITVLAPAQKTGESK